MSRWHLPSSVMVKPNFLTALTCSSVLWLSVLIICLFWFRDITGTSVFFELFFIFNFVLFTFLTFNMFCQSFSFGASKTASTAYLMLLILMPSTNAFFFFNDPSNQFKLQWEEIQRKDVVLTNTKFIGTYTLQDKSFSSRITAVSSKDRSCSSLESLSIKSRSLTILNKI